SNDAASFGVVAEAAKRTGSLILGQLCHPGYQASPPGLSERICVSRLPASGKEGDSADPPPTPLTIQQIEELRDAFVYAARILYDAGFDGVQLHAAYGHLFTQFLSAATNSRQDLYGGSFENRCRFLLQVLQGIREAIPDPTFVLSVKLNSSDFIQPESGFSAVEARYIGQQLEVFRVDVLELSGGAYEFPSALKPTEINRQRHSYYERFAEDITASLTRTLVTVNGALRSAARMRQIVESGKGSFVGLARVLCAEPDLPNRIMSGKVQDAKDNKIPSAGYQFLGAIYQLRAIGEDNEVSDYSDERTVDSFMATAKWI
ncbi:FMN-linked oxidoreductase, partial [Exidia glandulosa HHB12029]